MNIDAALDTINQALSKLSRTQIFAIALLIVAAIAIPDYRLGFEISLSIFYLLPVGIATWYVGKETGGIIAVITAFTSIAAKLGNGHFDTHPRIKIWNAFLHIGFMLVTVYLLDRLRIHAEIEKNLARSDSVTGIFNRRAFLEHLQYRIVLSAREGNPFTLAYIDLDDFKQVNDSQGHQEGDRILRLVASTLTESIRKVDIVARLGGDEFGLLIAGATRRETESLVSKLRLTLLNALDSTLTCSIGCVTFETPPPSIDAAIGAADALMYEVKSRGKNAVAFDVFGVRNTRIRAAPKAMTRGLR